MNAAAWNLGEGSGRVVMQDDSTESAGFSGTQNPRHLRALAALLRRPMPREQIDEHAGCSNGPDLILELRRRGLAIPCTRTLVCDRDGCDVWRGIYHLTPSDRGKIRRWLAAREIGSTR